MNAYAHLLKLPRRTGIANHRVGYLLIMLLLGVLGPQDVAADTWKRAGNWMRYYVDGKHRYSFHVFAGVVKRRDTGFDLLRGSDSGKFIAIAPKEVPNAVRGKMETKGLLLFERSPSSENWFRTWCSGRRLSANVATGKVKESLDGKWRSIDPTDVPSLLRRRLRDCGVCIPGDLVNKVHQRYHYGDEIYSMQIHTGKVWKRVGKSFKKTPLAEIPKDIRWKSYQTLPKKSGQDGRYWEKGKWQPFSDLVWATAAEGYELDGRDFEFHWPKVNSEKRWGTVEAARKVVDARLSQLGLDNLSRRWLLQLATAPHLNNDFERALIQRKLDLYAAMISYPDRVSRALEKDGTTLHDELDRNRYYGSLHFCHAVNDMMLPDWWRQHIRRAAMNDWVEREAGKLGVDDNWVESTQVVADFFDATDPCRDGEEPAQRFQRRLDALASISIVRGPDGSDHILDVKGEKVRLPTIHYFVEWRPRSDGYKASYYIISFSNLLLQNSGFEGFLQFEIGLKQAKTLGDDLKAAKAKYQQLRSKT